jgi:subtilisin family serine protease
VLVAALATALVGGMPAAAQDELELASVKSVEKGEYNSYIVIMQADPLVVTDRDALDTPKARARGRELRASHDRALRDAGINASRKVTEYVYALNGFSALVNYRQAQELAASPGVAMVLPDELRQAQTDESGDFIGLTGPGQAYDAGLTGAGVVVGVIDTGIWPEHPSFADNGLPAPPTGPLPCEFGNTGTVPGHDNPNDAPFTCQNKLIGARQMLTTYRAVIGAAADEFDSARDDNGHGTHTASTAAGNADVQAEINGQPVGDGTISGIAPDAHVIMYKGLGNLGGFTSDLVEAIDQAVVDGVDVINYSIGGGGTTISADEIAFLFAADAGVHVAASAGNTGPGAATVRSPAKSPWLTTVGASTQTRFLAGTIALGNGVTYEGASVTDGVGPTGLIDAATAAPGATGDLCISNATGANKLDPTLVAEKIVLCRRGTNARVDKSLAVKNAGGAGMIMYENDDVSNLFTDNHWLPTVHIDNTPGLAIKAYIAANPAAATAEIRDTRAISSWPSAASTTVFSSRGPNVFADVIKPDITAPGMQILAGGSPFVDAGSVPGELFQSIAGTSMSSPHVAGLLALLDQAHPDWSAATAKSALMTTAHQNVKDNNRTSASDPFDMGSGHANPGRADRHGSAFRPGLVYDADLVDYAAFVCGQNTGIFGNTTCNQLAAAGFSTDPSDLNYPSIAVAELAGVQTVTRTVTSVAPGRRTFNASVQAPNGYSVSVSPPSVTLSQGQSATFEVTITNNSAPLNEWRFGSMTWNHQSGNGVSFSVRSPIAVRAATFNAPSLVTASGVSGATSFDISFGYTGAYNATSHGLVPATLSAGNVLQDPNQTFAPSDVAAGGADVYEFPLNGAAVFRIAMPPEAAEAESDIDIFVANPAGNVVASSTAGGTDELITINNPANGTWKVYVHGWLAPGGDSDYTMYSWVISATPGGSLVITDAPAAATAGTAAEIDLSWTGATAGQWHFGAVSHNGPSGVMGRTLVQIDNR